MELTVNIDHEQWCESIRSDIDQHLALLDHAAKVDDPKMQEVLDDVTKTLRKCESRLAWLRYVATCRSSAFDSGDAGALHRYLDNPLSTDN